MLRAPVDIKEIFFQALHADITIGQFEQWVYNEKRLQSILSEGDYLVLLSFDYKKNGAIYELAPLLRRMINLGEYEAWKLRNLLLRALQRDDSLPDILVELYYLYQHGYAFLNTLALEYGLRIIMPPPSYSSDEFERLSVQEQSLLINSCYPALEDEIKKVLSWLDEGSIIFTGEVDYLGNYGYIDKR